jgi:transcriptional regulator with XRE-family HTH domain
MLYHLERAEGTGMKEIAERLKSLRLGVGFSQAQVAKILGVEQSTINRYEHDVGMPQHKRLLRYADYFDVSLDYIYGRTDNPQGKLYEYDPDALKGKFAERDELERFIEFCFEPGTAGNEKLKAVLVDMLGGKDGKNRAKRKK